MSTGPRLPLPEARTVANWLLERWAMVGDDCAIVGSIRRERADIGDIDLLAPLPETFADDGKDPLYDTIGTSLGLLKDDAGLFAGSRVPKPALTRRVIKGFNPGFKSLSLVIVGKSGREVPVNVERYVPGKDGNRGWKEVMRTGPEEFGVALLEQWKAVQRTLGTATPGSIDGFFADREGVRQPTPTEAHAFHLARCLWIAPRVRRAGTLLCVDWLRLDTEPEVRLRCEKVMGELGVLSREDCWDSWKEQTLALAGWKP